MIKCLEVLVWHRSGVKSMTAIVIHRQSHDEMENTEFFPLLPERNKRPKVVQYRFLHVIRCFSPIIGTAVAELVDRTIKRSNMSRNRAQSASIRWAGVLLLMITWVTTPVVALAQSQVAIPSSDAPMLEAPPASAEAGSGGLRTIRCTNLFGYG